MASEILLPKNISPLLPEEDRRDLQQVNTKTLKKSIRDQERIFPDWIGAYLEYTKTSASPPIYHHWVAMNVLGSALERKVWIDWEYENIYPNMYIFLVGSSGSKKGTALKLAKPILTAAEINKAPTMLTPEDFFDRMARQATVFTNEDDPQEILVEQTCYNVIADELRVFMGGDIDKFIGSLTDIYDCREKGDPWHYSTKHQGEAFMENQWLSIIAGTTPDYIKNSLPAHARNEGFLSRVILVHSNPVKIKETLPPSLKIKAGLMEGEAAQLKMEEYKEYRNKHMEFLVDDLKQVMSLYGPLDIQPQVLRAYDEWMKAQEDLGYEDKLHLEKSQFGGYITRRSTYLRRLMILYSVSRNNELVITMDDFTSARDLLYKTELSMPRVFTGMPQSFTHEEIVYMIMQYIWNSDGKFKKSALVRDMIGTVDLDSCGKALENLIQAKILSITNLDLSSADYTYELTDLGKDKAKEFFLE